MTSSDSFSRFRRYKDMRRLKSIILLCAVVLAGALVASAETVSQKQAKHIAAQFFNAAHAQVMGEPKLVYNGRRLTTNSLFPPFYVYNLPAGGFVVVSAENKAFPILGYDLKANFDPEKMTTSLKELLRLYALHIENIRYDSSVPYEAEKAWVDIPGYIAGLLDAPYKATDPVTTRPEAENELQAILDMDNPYSFASSSYTPDQWQYAIDLELDMHREVVLGLVKDDSLLPVIVHGHKGDYYRMDLDGRNTSLWRLLPTEIVSKGEVAVLGNPTAVEPAGEPEEAPHSFYENFVRENQVARDNEQSAIENSLVVTEPKVKWLGGGHFSVVLPEEVKEMRLYSLDGAQVQYEKFRDTSVANVNLSGQPVGFYFATFFGCSGMPYTIKIFR